MFFHIFLYRLIKFLIKSHLRIKIYTNSIRNIKMQTEKFTVEKVRTLTPADARKYIDEYFIPLDDGTHAMLKDGKYHIMDTPKIKGTYFNRMSKELQTYYFKEKCDIRSIIYDIDKPVLTATELNLCPQKKHIYKPC